MRDCFLTEARKRKSGTHICDAVCVKRGAGRASGASMRSGAHTEDYRGRSDTRGGRSDLRGSRPGHPTRRKGMRHRLPPRGGTRPTDGPNAAFGMDAALRGSPGKVRQGMRPRENEAHPTVWAKRTRPCAAQWVAGNIWGTKTNSHHRLVVFSCARVARRLRHGTLPPQTSPAPFGLSFSSPSSKETKPDGLAWVDLCVLCVSVREPCPWLVTRGGPGEVDLTGARRSRSRG